MVIWANEIYSQQILQFKRGDSDFFHKFVSACLPNVGGLTEILYYGTGLDGDNGAVSFVQM